MENGKFDNGIKEYNEGAYFFSKGQKKLAIDRMLLSAQKGYSKAQFFMACAYYNGDCGLGKNIFECEKWAKEAANQNLSDACLFLGHIYLNSENPIYNLDYAVHYYDKALDLGEYEAAYYLGMIYLMDEYLNSNDIYAQRYFNLAISHDIPSGYYGMGLYYEKANDKENARKYYELAKMYGYDEDKVGEALNRVYPQGFFIEHFKGAVARLITATIISLIILLIYIFFKV